MGWKEMLKQVIKIQVVIKCVVVIKYIQKDIKGDFEPK